MQKFSIIIPTYNQPRLAKRAIRSVMQQDTDDWEIIVSDDSENDDIRHMAESLQESRLRYLRHEPGETAADNWNHGLQAAEGKYLILMHHDEAFEEPTHLAQTARAFEAGAEVVVSDIRICAGGKTSTGRPDWLKRLTLRHPAWLMLCNTIGPTACIAFRREQLQLVDNRLSWIVDAEWYYRLLKGRNTVFLKSLSILSEHGHQGQISRRLDVEQAYRRDKAVIDETYRAQADVRRMTALYGQWIIRTKKLLGKL